MTNGERVTRKAWATYRQKKNNEVPVWDDLPRQDQEAFEAAMMATLEETGAVLLERMTEVLD